MLYQIENFYKKIKLYFEKNKIEIMKLKSTIIEIQKWLNSKFELIQERISQVDNRLMKIRQSKNTQKKKIKKSELKS